MNLTRRGFLKTSALTGVTAIALLGCDDAVTDTIVEDTTPIGNLAEGKWVGAGCTGCTSWCTSQAYVVNGRVLKVRGNVNSKSNKKNNCPRMHLGIQQMYDPDRISSPMKRTNPNKGRNEDPGFVPISWNEAMTTIAQKHKELIDAGETHKFVLFRGRYTNNNDLNYGRMVRLLGSPNNISHSSICAEAEKFGPMYTEGFGGYRDYDLDYAKYVLCWGMDPLCTNRQVSNWLNKWGNVLDRATVAVVEPRLTSTASKAHEWLPVNSGYDAPVALAIAHVALVEGLWYKGFVGDFTDGVNKFVAGQEVDEASFDEKHTHGIVKWWNHELKDRTPEWAAQLSGVPVEQIIRVARGMGAAAPAVCVMMGGGAVMQQRGGYTSMAIHALAGIFGGSDNQGGTQQNPPGALQGLPGADDFNLSVPDSQKIDQRGYLEWPNLATGSTGVNLNRVADAILAENPYDIKLAYGYWVNTPYSCPEPDRWERALAKVPFFVHHVVHMAEMSWYADILLPSTHSNFEQWGSLHQKQDLHMHVWLARPIDKPFPEAKNPETEYVWLLGEKLAELGVSNLIDYCKTLVDPETGNPATSAEEFDKIVTKIRTQPAWDPALERPGNLGSWEQFVEVGVWNSTKYVYRSKWDNYATVTKKFEFYSETLKDRLQKFADNVTNYKAAATIDEVIAATNYTATGDLRFLPHYEEPIIEGNSSEYPLVFVDHKARLNREGRAANTSWYQEFSDVDFGREKWGDTVILHPSDVTRLGLADGDSVVITSPTGQVRNVKVRAWEGTVPGHAVKAYGQGHWNFGRNADGIGGNNNDVIPAVYEHLSGSTVFYASTRVKVEKA
ncbi:molybdopterin-dependent oxidoreductase [Desulfuribacillus alkaliarsenatis]|uniref:4Fe-4S Mo/W bis-MGD-type domain-containing protein n=1 Tax=Desulfuribacillus alkaliarsenatis TaxID=766136 RepID=A0A1E5G0N8_9FIRM|nr:molybdopterin-dependent oxidoreductase [Desulfuribacillus alkaliarsenatis]OEF96488.1 hypothetical protein BHF68_07475 [Desulfuribacillus alkaliarsenatis]